MRWFLVRNPVSWSFMFLSCLVLAVLVLPFATMLVSELNDGHLRCDIFHFLGRKTGSAAKVKSQFLVRVVPVMPI